MIRNLNTYHVSPQFHVMYDDLFETVHSNEESPPAPEVWVYTFKMLPLYWDVKPLKLAMTWLSQGERHARRESELESHKVSSMPRGPTAQREQEGTTEGALPATSQEDVQAPLIRNALAPSPQQLPAQTTTPVSQVSPCQVLPGLVQREQQVGSAERALAQAFSQEDLRVPFVEKAAAPSPQKHEAPVVQGLSPVAQASSNAVDPIRGQSTRSIRGVASQRFTYKVKGQPTIYSLVECFHKLIPGLVACEDQREHKQREFLVMMSSTDGTIEKWPRPLKEYPRVYKAGN